MSELRAAAWLVAGLMVLANTSVAQTTDGGPLTRGECVGPLGSSPTIVSHPSGGKVGAVSPATSYTVSEVDRCYALLRATRYSKPFLPGTTVGWVRMTDLHLIMLRNCI